MKAIVRNVLLPLVLAALLIVPAVVFSEESPVPGDRPVLSRAVMCEALQKFTPVNEAVIFSVELGRIHCFTEFDQVPKQTIIYHKWYHRGTLVSAKQLTLNPPSWSSFTSMQLRDADKGPWQIDITDANDNIIRTLRFSVTD